MIEIKEKQNCCGCTACAAICPNECINMREDAEGFKYPQINREKCIDCGACERICPILNVKTERYIEQQAYIVQNKDETVLCESTAGGAFTAIAKYVLRQNGVVFGVEMNEQLLAHHSFVEKESELARFRNSKYVQSDVGGGTFKQVKSFLNQGRTVCFSGTPCQIEGLKSFLRHEYDNLITVDVVCRAVPSPMIFQKYLEYQKKTGEGLIKSVRFRDKYYGYKYSTMNVITDKNNGKYHQGVESDPWLRAFFSNICDRPSCHHCQFRKQYRVSDFTIWDCFHVGHFSKALDNDKGATRVLVHTKKGQKIIGEILGEFRYVQVEPEDIVTGAKEMKESVLPNPLRNDFFVDANRLDGSRLFQKYFPNTVSVRAKHGLRLFFYHLGIYDIIKRAYMRLKHKY